MTISDVKKVRIKQLTKEGLPTSIIAERVNMSAAMVNYYQKAQGVDGLRKKGGGSRGGY